MASGFVLLLAETDLDRLHVVSSVPEGLALEFRELGSVQRGSLPGAVIIAAENCACEFCRGALAEVRRLHLQDSTVLVLPLNCGNARAMRMYWEGEVVWSSEIETRLSSLLQQLLVRDIRHQVHRLLAQRIDGHSRGLSQALRSAFLSESVPESYEALLAASELSDSAFRRQCRQAGLQARSEALADLALLTHACHALEAGMHLHDFCRCVGVEPWRVHRASYRRAGVAAGALEAPRLLAAVTSLFPDA